MRKGKRYTYTHYASEAVVGVVVIVVPILSRNADYKRSKKKKEVPAD